MKSKKIIVGLLSLMAISGMGWAKDGSVHLFGQIEAWSYSDAFKQAENEWDKVIADDSQDPDTMVTSETKTKGGAGVRLGALINVPVKGLEVGGSLGYINGPSFEGHETIDDTFTTDPYSDSLKSNIFRALIEMKESLPIGNGFYGSLGLGFGLAKVNIKHEYVNGGNIGSHFGEEAVIPGTSKSGSDTSSFTKFTWEVGPSIGFETKAVGFELGVVYAELPQVKSDQFQEFKWNPFGIRLGVTF